MPGISILKLFTLFGIVSTWAEKALEDGKITLTEAAQLAERLGPLLGVPVHIEADLDRRVSDLDLETPETENHSAGIVNLKNLEERPHSRRSPT